MDNDSINELDVVRIVRLANPARKYTGSELIARPPQIGDTGTVVHRYDPSYFCVECVAEDGRTVWLADFAAEEVEVEWRVSDRE